MAPASVPGINSPLYGTFSCLSYCILWLPIVLSEALSLALAHTLPRTLVLSGQPDKEKVKFSGLHSACHLVPAPPQLTDPVPCPLLIRTTARFSLLKGHLCCWENCPTAPCQIHCWCLSQNQMHFTLWLNMGYGEYFSFWFTSVQILN